jgi:hypothetical protein
MTRTLLAVVALVGLTAAASAQTYVTPVYPSSYRTAWPTQRAGTFNYNNPLYHGVYPPTGYYPGGYVSSHAYTNAGDTVPTTYVSHYRSLPVVEVPVVTVPVVQVPVVETYTEVRGYGYYPPVYRSGRGRWR